MADTPKVPTPTGRAYFTADETMMIMDALDQAAKSYRRAQHQRPQFATVAAEIEKDLIQLIAKIKTFTPTA